MDQVEELDAAISSLLRTLTIDERQLLAGLETVPFNPIDLETLSFVHRKPGSVAKDLAAYLGVRSTTMQSAIDRLERRGLLRRDTSTLKGRAVALTLTDEGSKLRNDIHLQNLKNCNRMLECIEDEDRPDFIRNMGRIASKFPK